MMVGRALALALLSMALLTSGVARADTDPLAYDDPGMHFRPPDGWQRVQFAESSDVEPSGPHPVAAWVLQSKKMDQRQIIITVEPFDGSLGNFESSHESDLRNEGKDQSLFVDKKEMTTLANGMPAYFMRVNQGNAAGQFVRSYQYVVIDKQRGIVVAYSGRAGQFDDKEAKAAMASLYVVVYPKHLR